MRRAVFIIAAVHAALFAWAIVDTASSAMDAANRGMAYWQILSYGAIAAAFLLPAVALAALGRAPRTALILALAPAGAALFQILAGGL